MEDPFSRSHVQAIASGGWRPTTESGEGVLVVGHGTRSRPGTEQFLKLVEGIQQLIPEVVVEPSFS